MTSFRTIGGPGKGKGGGRRAGSRPGTDEAPPCRDSFGSSDNVTNQMVALGILKKFGLRADVVANGREAIKALESVRYDLVLMDVQMPEMDGLEATRKIRSGTLLNRDVPIIAMTAHAMQGDRDRCLEAGMNDYVAKPVDPKTLACKLAQWLHARSAETDKATAEAAQYVCSASFRRAFRTSGEFERRV
ncbi:MAG: response regulator [Acidobacteria bacterium]|nr:MAG: response regulator [Acidobacteriota bacterium]